MPFCVLTAELLSVCCGAVAGGSAAAISLLSLLFSSSCLRNESYSFFFQLTMMIVFRLLGDDALCVCVESVW